MIKYLLTTVDNPYNPDTQYDQWLAFDEEQGYFTWQLVARIAKVSNELSQKDEELAIANAIDEVAKYNVSGMHRKIEV